MLVLGGSREVPGASHGAEITQLVQLHGSETPAGAAMCFAYESHSIHILDLGLAKLYPRCGGPKDG